VAALAAQLADARAHADGLAGAPASPAAQRLFLRIELRAVCEHCQPPVVDRNPAPKSTRAAAVHLGRSLQ
jgi:hypothetical protein